MELDPTGNNVGTFTPYFELNLNVGEPDVSMQTDNTFLPHTQIGAQYMAILDGIQVPYWILGTGESAAQCPNNYCGARVGTNSQGQRVITSPFQAYADGNSGFEFPTPKKQKPTLNQTGRKTKAEVAEARALAATGIFNNEADDVDPPDWGNESLLDSLIKGLNLLILTQKNVKVIGFTEEQEKMIGDSLAFMLLSKPCADAFRAAGIPTPAEVIRDRGVLFIHRDMLAPPLSNTLKTLGFSEARRNDYYASTGRTMMKKGGGVTPDPKLPINLGMPATTILWDSSFNGGSNFSFGEIMSHESIHRSGVGENYAWYQNIVPFVGHDLTGLDEQYENIIKNCQQP